MSFLARVERGAGYLNPHHAREEGMYRGPSFVRTLAAHGAETSIYAGSSYLAGRINTQYGARAKWRGHDKTYVAGLLGKSIVVAADLLGMGGGLLNLADTASNALIGAHFVAKGAEDGMRAAGGSAPRSLPAAARASAPLPAAKVAGTALGAIPPAPQPGRYMDLDKVAAIAAM